MFSLAACLLFFAGCPAAHASLKVGQPAPALEVTTFDGQVFNLSHLRGKTVLIHFWATWCPTCRHEMPMLSSYFRKNQDRLAMIGLSLDRPRDREAAVKAMRDLTFPAAMLDDAKVNDFDSPKSLPATYVIDPRGLIRAIYKELTEDILTKAMDNAMAPELRNN